VTAAPLPADPGDLARSLYAAMRDLDDAGAEVIVADAVAETGLGRALMDRLRRAATLTIDSDADADSAS
jgi:L-threonylcarbamoyladenylate synthase